MELSLILIPILSLIGPSFAIVGKSSNPDSSRIQYGLTADIGDIPFIVSIITKKNKSSDCCFVCAGVLIKPNYVLTSARCVSQPKSTKGKVKLRSGTSHSMVPYKPDELFIYPNFENRPMPLESDPVIAVKELWLHPKWKGNAPYDLAVLKAAVDISSSLKKNSEIRPVPMKPSITERDLKGEIVLAGYGVTEKASSPPHRLLKTLALKLNSQSKCSDKFDVKRYIALRTVCATHEKGNPSGVCKGDDGGPVLQWVHKKGYQLIGIVSEGYKCDYVSRPQIFTLIDFKWIQEQISGKGGDDESDSEENDGDDEEEEED